MGTAPQDLTGRARLRDAAIEAFAAQGFDVPLRAIAQRAQVTAGLVRHHFGSKQALRAECDDVVLERYRRLKRDSLGSDPHHLFTHLPDSRDSGILLMYILRCAHDGADAGRIFVTQLIDEATDLMQDAVARGLVVPSRDEPARVRYMVLQSLGTLVLNFALNPPADPEDFTAVMRRYYAEVTLPTLELYTEGLFTRPDYLNMYLAATAADNPPAHHAGDSLAR